MRNHQASQKKSSAQKAKSPTFNPLESRPFAVHRKPEETERSPETKGYESAMPSFAILNPEGGRAMPVQPKLTIGAPGDKYEQEADRVASQVVKQINSPDAAKSSQGQSVQRMKAPVEELPAKPRISDLQRSPLPLVQREAMPAGEYLQAKSNLQRGSAVREASMDLESAINSARGSGQPLEAGLQRSMGQAMGADFSGVKVHTDAQADQLNQSIQAKAFTTGQDVFFRQGAYDPGSRGGQELIAHELTHVVQQNGTAVQKQQIQSKSNRSIASTVFKKNGAAIQATNWGEEGNNSPNRVGIEEELASVSLKCQSNDKDKKNGVELAKTNEEAFNKLPVFKLVTEGADRGSLCIELIYGPLQMEEYNDKNFKIAKEILLEQLKKKQSLKDALNNYNSKQKHKRYKLTITPQAEAYTIDKHTQKVTINRQTNVAIPYSKLGEIPQKEEQGFEEMFGDREKDDRKMYKKAREEAHKIKKDIDEIQEDRHLISLLTHIIFQEAKFIKERINKEKIKPEDKHKFHVMLKLSQEDAIVGIISEEEKVKLGDWLKEGEEQLRNSIKSTLDVLNSSRKYEIDIKTIKEQIEKAIEVRDKGAVKLEQATNDNDKIIALDQSGDRQGTEIRHTHPRPTNRVPVYSHDGEYYMVVEQRSAKHKLNTEEATFEKKTKLINAQQKKTQQKKTQQKKTQQIIPGTQFQGSENETTGDGNCFFHAVYECLNNKRSTNLNQEEIRDQYRNELQKNNDIREFLFQNNAQMIQAEIESVETGKWTQDHTIGYVAEALNLKIRVLKPDLTEYYTGEARNASKTIYIIYRNGNHFNSFTTNPL